MSTDDMNLDGNNLEQRARAASDATRDAARQMPLDVASITKGPGMLSRLSPVLAAAFAVVLIGGVAWAVSAPPESPSPDSASFAAQASTTTSDASTSTAPDDSSTTSVVDGSTSTTGADGTTSTTAPDGSTTSTSVADGSTTTSTVADGSTTTTTPDGSTTTTTPDASTTTTTAPGGSTTTTTVPDGSTTTTSTSIPDSTTSTTVPNIDGTYVYEVPGVGTVTVTVSRSQLFLDAVNTDWQYEIEKQEVDRIRIDFTNGELEARIEIRLEDGVLEVEIDD